MRTKSVLVAATTALVVWGTWQTATAQPLPVDVNSFVGASQLTPYPYEAHPMARFYGPYYVRRPQTQSRRASIAFLRRLENRRRQDAQDALQQAEVGDSSLEELPGPFPQERVQGLVLAEEPAPYLGASGARNNIMGVGARAAMLRDRPGRSCASGHCRRKIDSSLNLLMRMMETGKR